MMSAPATHWSRIEERGAAWGLRLTALCYRALGRPLAWLLLYPVVAYFFLTGRSARAASQDYLRRLHLKSRGATPAPTPANSFRHMLSFARAGIDKLAAWSGGLPQRRVDFPQRAALERVIAGGRGAVLLGAHLGNLEMTRALAHERGLKGVHAVVFAKHASRFVSILARANPAFAENLIHAAEIGPDMAIKLRERIELGELLAIVGDRTPVADNGRVVTAEFLGAPAAFPQGPFILASLLECPVYLFLCLEEAGRYRIHLEPFADRIDLPRGAREDSIARYAQDYARRLEEHCLRAPLQWFNFFDFWQPVRAGPGHG